MNKAVKKAGLLALKLSVSGGLLYLVLSKVGIDKVFSLLRNITPLMFLLSVLLYIFALYLSTIRWALLLPDKFGMRKLFPLYLIGSFFNTFMPGLVGGDAVKIYYLYKETGKGTQALGSVFMDRYIGIFTMMSMGLVAFPFGIKYFHGSWLQWVLPVMALGFLLGSTAILGLRVGKGMKFLSDFYNFLHDYRRRRAVMAKAAVLSAALQLVIIFSIYLLGLGLGVRIPFFVFLIFVPIIVVVSTLPVSIAGIGLREASSVVLLGSVGVNAETATALSFSWFVLMAAAGLPGLVEYIRYKGNAPA